MVDKIYSAWLKVVDVCSRLCFCEFGKGMSETFGFACCPICARVDLESGTIRIDELFEVDVMAQGAPADASIF